jgi:hypothetical protein
VQRDVLQLTDSLARHPKFLAHFLERLWLLTIQSESGVYDPALPVIEDVEQLADFLPKIFVTQGLKRVVGFIIAHNLAEFG